LSAKYSLIWTKLQEQTVDQNKKPNGAPVVYSYRGQDSHGYFRLHGAGEELLIGGALYAASHPGKMPPSGPRKIALIELKTSPDFVRDREQDSTFPVRTATGERLRVIGKIVHASRLLEVKKHRVFSPAPIEPVAPKPTVAPPKKARGKPTKEQQLEREGKRVADLAAQGHDPEVRMKFVAWYIGMSASNLYKKIEAGTFPPQTKRDSGSYWKFSTLQAYLSK
jgi:predicted DNA-binding transcriptional regulator AlpA